MALLAAYNFDEPSGDVVDHSGNSRDWALNTGAQRTTGDGGHTDEGLTKLGAGMAAVASPAFGQASSRTFMFWMKGQGNAVWWLRFYIAGDDTGSWGLYLLSGNLTLRLRKGGANTNTTVSWTDDGAWHHYAGTYDGTNGRLYKDGTLVATSSTVAAPLDNADSIQVLETSLTTQTMDDLRFYDQALDQATIATLMGTPVGSSESHSGTVALSASAAANLSAAKSVARSAPIAAAAAMPAVGVRSSAATATLTASGVVGVAGVRSAAGGAALTVSAFVAAAGSRASAGTAPLTSAGGMQLSGVPARSGTGTLAAHATLAAHQATAASQTPPERTFVTPPEPRLFTVSAESRVWEGVMDSAMKDPDATLDYKRDWSVWLVDDDTITASTWIVPPGLTMDSETHTDKTATVWLSGGTLGESYTITNRVSTGQGRTDDRSALIVVRQR